MQFLQKYDTLSLEEPDVADNSGAIAELTVSQPVNGPVSESLSEVWTATDYAGNEATCELTVMISGKNIQFSDS